MTKTKICVRCNEEKPFTKDYFHKHIITRKYRHRSAFCIECHKKRMKIYNKESYRNNRSKAMVGHYKRTDKKTGYGITDLTEEWFEKNINTQPCSYCGTTNEPIGMDRIDNDKGHTTDNVIPCCKICNKVRNNIFTVEEMKKLGKVIAKIKSKRLL